MKSRTVAALTACALLAGCYTFATGAFPRDLSPTASDLNNRLANSQYTPVIRMKDGTEEVLTGAQRVGAQICGMKDHKRNCIDVASIQTVTVWDRESCAIPLRLCVPA